MATTSTYQSYLQTLLSGSFATSTIAINIALFKPEYTPDIDNDNNYVDLRSTYEVDDDAANGGYEWGGQTIPDIQITWDATNKVLKLITSESISWTSITGTVRYAVLYYPQQVASAPLIGYIDFGVDQTYAGEPLTVQFPNGIVVLKVS